MNKILILAVAALALMIAVSANDDSAYLTSESDPVVMPIINSNLINWNNTFNSTYDGFFVFITSLQVNDSVHDAKFDAQNVINDLKLNRTDLFSFHNITNVPCFNCSIPYTNITGMDRNYSNLTNTPHGQVSFYDNNQGSVIPTGLKPVNPTIHYNGSFVEIVVSADQVGSFSIDIYKGNITSSPIKVGNFNFISQQKLQSNDFSVWTDILFVDDDNFQFNVTSVTNITWINIDIETVKT